MRDSTPIKSSNWTLGIVVCPPLFFVRRRKWVAAILASSFYLLGEVFAIIRIAGVGSAPDDAMGGLITGGLVWLLCLIGVGVSRRRDKAAIQAQAEGRPSASLRSRILEGALIVSVPLVTTLGIVMMVGDSQSRVSERGRTSAALCDAQWVAAFAEEYNKAEGRMPVSITELRTHFPESDIDGTDPWGRPWILSPASGETDRGDVFICSRGRLGNGVCVRNPSPLWSHGALGYSVRSGTQMSPEEIPWGIQLAGLSGVALVVIALPAYIVQRLIRRWRGRPAPFGGGSAGAAIVLLFLAIVLQLFDDFAPLGGNHCCPN